MAFRGGRGRGGFGRGGGGFGRGGGGFGRGGGGFGRGQQLPFKLFPDIEEGLGIGKPQRSPSAEHMKLIEWYYGLKKYWNSSPYFYEDKTAERANKVQKTDIERYSDRDTEATPKKPPLFHYIKLDTDHVPAELAKAGARKVKNVRWDMESSLNTLDDEFNKIEQKVEGLIKERLMANKADEEEEENNEENEESDEEEFGDDEYDQAVYCDDDEDDFNDVDEGDDEAAATY